MRVLLVDDHPLFLEGLKSLLTVRGIDVVGTANDGWTAVEVAKRVRPEVVLMDMQMPNCNGLQAMQMIKAELPTTQVVMLTMAADDASLFQAIQSGASGYVPKSLNIDAFYALLMGLSRGEAAIPSDLAAKIMGEFANPTHRAPKKENRRDKWKDLTPRQLEVLQLAALGQSNNEIAEALVITERTVKYHMHEILEKLQMRNRVQAISYAIQAGLLPVASNS